MKLLLHLTVQLVSILSTTTQLNPQAGQHPELLQDAPLAHMSSDFKLNAPVGGAPNAAPATSESVSGVRPQEVYNGGYAGASPVRLRIANGGAGQSGLIREWANAFIQHMVQSNNSEPFQVAWYLGDTTDSLAMLDAGAVDVAATYNEAAERILLDRGSAKETVYAFRGYFALVGPKSNPAGLNSRGDGILTMLGKIAVGGKDDDQRPPNPSERLPVRFLSRFDKSATNIKESELFLKIGQIPWALAYAKWYHQYPQFPTQSLRAASVLGEYSLTDMATLATVTKSDESGILDNLDVFRAGRPGGRDADLLLNPCHVLLGAKADPANLDIAKAFIRWIDDATGGRRVIRMFGKNGEDGFFEAPLDSSNNDDSFARG